MKVLLHYEDTSDKELHKSLKLTLPKSWKTGPISQLISQFVESYNPKFPTHPLVETELHLALKKPIQGINVTAIKTTELVPLPKDGIVLEEIPDRADVYVCHGPSQTKQEIQMKFDEEKAKKHQALASTVACTHFGCQNRFPKGGPYPKCTYHSAPPVFHETAKYWACCPNKKAYDWEEFQRIPGCQTGTCTDLKQDDGQKLFLGGTDLRAQAGDTGPTLKSIDDFNKSLQAGGAQAAPVLQRLETVFCELGMEKELIQQVLEGIKKQICDANPNAANNDAELLELVAKELGSKLKASLKSIAAEQLRIK